LKAYRITSREYNWLHCELAAHKLNHSQALIDKPRNRQNKKITTYCNYCKTTEINTDN